MDNTLEAKFDRILKQYAAAFSRLAAAYERDDAMREDLLQEIALAVWRALPSFRGECSERTFLYRIAHNRALTHISKRRPATSELGDADQTADGGPTPEEVFKAAELRTRLQEAIAELPVALKQVWVLALEGVENPQIAEILGITENNVAVRLARGRQHLRRLLRGEP